MVFTRELASSSKWESYKRTPPRRNVYEWQRTSTSSMGTDVGRARQFVQSPSGSGRGDVETTSPGNYGLDEQSPTHISSAEAFWSTVRRYTDLNSVDPQHLADTLRLTMHHGEPVTAERIWQAAGALARGGYSRQPTRAA